MSEWQRAFDVQMGLWHRWENTDVERFVQDRLGFRGASELEKAAMRQSLEAMKKTMLLADPIFVSADMCKLIEVAQESFYPEPMYPDELITPCGFLLFEEPIEVLNGHPGDQVRMPYVGLSWIGIENREQSGVFALALTTYDAMHQFDGVIRDGLPGVWDLQMWQFGVAAENRYVGWWRLAQTTFRLMQEFKPVSRTQATLARAARRRAQRVGFEPREITVVTLRRERGLSEHLGGSANYSHRFIRSAHWRNQWYPTLGQHRKKWIEATVVGSKDLPFKPTRGRAFRFIR